MLGLRLRVSDSYDQCSFSPDLVQSGRIVILIIASKMAIIAVSLICATTVPTVSRTSAMGHC